MIGDLEQIEKIDVKTLRQRIYERLRELIMSGKLQPGQTISLRSLAQRFGVSLMPVREALWQLESDGVVIVQSNRNIRVNSLSAVELEEALRLRFMLESEAARRACDRRPECALPKLRALLRAMQDAIHKPRRYIDIANEFHRRIYACADSPLLLQMIERIQARTGPYFYLHVSRSEDHAKTIRHHEEIFAAFAAKDKRRLVAALRADINDPAKRIISAMKLQKAHRSPA